VSGAPVADVEILVDDVHVPVSLIGANQYVDPGEHQIVAKHGDTVVRQSVNVSEGEQEQANIDLAASAQGSKGDSAGGKHVQPQYDSRGSTQRLLGWVGLGVGATGIAVGTTAGIMVAVKHSKLTADCTNNVCDREKVNTSSADSYNSWRTVSTIGLVAGAVGTAIGLTLLLTAPDAEKPRVGVWLGPDSAGIRGAF
jgi:hypothetical protein